MRLIDADKVKIDSRKHCIDCKLNGTKQCKTCVINLICDRMDLQPSVKLDESVIQEVLNKRCMTVVTNEYLIQLHGKRPHSKWVIEHDWVHCSSCGYEQNYPSKFCPNCGADMRGDKNG